MADTSKQGTDTTPEQPRVIWRKVDPVALHNLLEEWMHGDVEEQRETFEALKKGLDEHRPEGYKLFPEG